MDNNYPIHIPSKGRYDSNITVKALERMKVTNYWVVIEEQEYDLYRNSIGKDHLLVLDKRFQDDYNTLDDLEYTKSKGPGAARNFAWHHAISKGYDWHWVMDDNIFRFSRYNKNNYYEVLDPVFFRIMEDFCLRYENIAMAGPNYEMFVARKDKHPPFVTNTRIYSCNLIRNDVPFRWRGRYNEDTIISLDMLNAGWCTVQFNVFLQFKATTQTVKGGCNTDFYSKEGTLPKSKMLVNEYPQYARLSWKFGRAHHHVDYGHFKQNKLRKRKDLNISKGNNDYGMKLKEVKKLEK
jgi:hypothetical protein